MPPRNTPGAKDKYGINSDTGKSFDETMTAKDGTKLMVRKETTPAFTHDGYGRKPKADGLKVTVPVSRSESRVPISSKPTANQVTPGVWRSKNKIDGKC